MVRVFQGLGASCLEEREMTVNPRSKDVDFIGFGSSRFLTLRGGIPRSAGSFPGV